MLLTKVFKMKRMVAKVLGLSAVLVAIGGIGYTALRSQNPPPFQPTEPPDDLVNLPAIPGAGPIAVYQDLARSWYSWDTIQKELTIKRRTRETTSSPWSEQIQELTTSYFIVDVRSVCAPGGKLGGLFLAGLYPNGDACIERWTFTYPSGLVGGYIPIDLQPYPTVRRVELYRGSEYGRISCLEPDPESRFLLFLTRESHTLYRRNLSTGSVTVELAPGTQPLLAEIHRIVARQHATQGRKFVLSTTPRWQTMPTGSTDVLVMSDSSNDGVFESTVRLTVQAWVSAGYANNPAAWTSMCP